MTLEEKVHGLRLHVIRRAQELGNVSQACRDAGISRALFYRWQKRLERYGLDGVHPRRQRARAGRPVQLDPETERLLLSVAVSAATWGAAPDRRLSGPEFKGAFDVACRALGIRHTRIKPRHAWTNGFVERLQGTILQEHCRIAFRRRYFTGRRALQQSLDAYMRSYNHDRPHQGYRLRGRTPAALFRGAVAA